jgi:hypothetical protein
MNKGHSSMLKVPTTACVLQTYVRGRLPALRAEPRRLHSG